MIDPCPSSRTFDPRVYKNSTFKTVLISVPDAILGSILILLGTLFILFPSVKNLIVSFLYMLHTVKWNLTWMQAMKCRLLRYCYSTCFSLKINFMVTENKKIGRFARMFCLCNYYRTIIWIEIWNELWNNYDLLFCSMQLYDWCRKELDRHPRFSTWHHDKSAVITWGTSSCTGNRFSVNIAPKKARKLIECSSFSPRTALKLHPHFKTISKHHTLAP